MKSEERGRAIELILSDVDGVLTNGGIIYDNQGIELKQFHVRDGLGIKLWRRAGLEFGIITGRNSHIVRLRAQELGVALIRQGVEDKWRATQQVMEELRLEPSQVAYIGDDLPDLAVIQRVGWGVAVADAVPELKRAAAQITTVGGGCGAVREVVEGLLKARGMWDGLIQKYSAT